MTITPPASSTNTPTRGPHSPSSPGMDLDAPSAAASASASAAAATPAAATPDAAAAPAAPSTPPPADAAASGASTASASVSAVGSAAPASPRSEGDPIDVDEPEEEGEVKRTTSGPGAPRKEEQLPDAWLVDRWNKDLGDVFVATKA